jgi:zinc transporter 2
MTFGYHRSEVIGALISILIIWILTAVLVYLAILRIITRNFEIEPVAMLTTASCGVLFNIIMFFILNGDKFIACCKKNHKHDENNEDSLKVNGGNTKISLSELESQQIHKINVNESKELSAGKKKEKNSDKSNINLRAAAIHVIGDLIQSIGILIAAIIIYFKV